MTREETKEYVERAFGAWESEYSIGDDWSKEHEACRLAIKALEQEPRWIPVSERLPEAFSFVNCTCHSLIDDREDWVVETFYLPQPPDSPYSDWGNIPMLNMGDCEVIAWMYRDIPKPYKVEPQESEDKE